MLKKNLQNFIFIILFFGCLSTNIKYKIKNENDDFFIDMSEKCLKEKKYLLLTEISNLKLKLEPDSYIAAYYKALSLQKITEIGALDYYLYFIKSHKEIPDEYKEKWLDFALAIPKIKLIKLKFINEKIKFDSNENSSNYCIPKILKNALYFFYLDSEGNLYKINRTTDKVDKINYYKTRDFVLFNDFIIFNDSINLIKYYFEINKYTPIYTFEKDDIIFCQKFHNYYIVVKYSDIKTNNDFNKLIDLNINKITELPKNYIVHSYDFYYIIIKYIDKFEVYDINGNRIVSLPGEFIGFNKDSTEIFFISDSYFYKYYLYEKNIEKLLFLKNINKINSFKALTLDKFLFSFDDYNLVMNTVTDKIVLIKGELLHVFNSGYLYRDINNDYIYFFNFYDNTISLIFKNSDILKNTVFSDTESNIFLVKDKTFLTINNITSIY